MRRRKLALLGLERLSLLGLLGGLGAYAENVGKIVNGVCRRAALHGPDLYRLVVLVIVAARAEENIYHEHQARHDQNRVGDVEHREVDKLELEHVHNIAEENTVDAVAERTGEKQHFAPHRKARVENALDQQHGDHNAEHREEYPARIVNIVKQAERRAGVVDINKLHHARDQLLRAGRERYIYRDPIFQPLIRNEYHRGNDRKKHVPILSVINTYII